MPMTLCYIYYAMDKNTKDILETLIFIKDRMATKDDITKLEGKIDTLRPEIRDIRQRLESLEEATAQQHWIHERD